MVSAILTNNAFILVREVQAMLLDLFADDTLPVVQISDGATNRDGCARRSGEGGEMTREKTRVSTHSLTAVLLFLCLCSSYF